MKKYDSYKDSGIEWIGEIPEHWGIATVGRLVNLGRGRVISAIEIAENEGEYPVYSSQTENNGIMGKLNSYDFEGQYVTWTTDGANAGTVFYREGKFNCTNVCGTMQPKCWEQLDLKYLPYYLNLGTKFSVRLDINPKLMNNMMAKIPLVIPSKSEQSAIANYLDRKTAEIDELIADKKRLLELYEEEKTAIINELVTGKKVWNGDAWTEPAEVKDSGIECLPAEASAQAGLGEIPEHWEVKKLKHLVSKIGSGVTPSGGSSVYQTSGIPLLRSQNIHFDGLKLDDVAYITEEIDEGMSNSRIQENDVLLNITGASIGRCFYVPIGFGRGNVNQHVCILRPIIQKIDVQFLYYQMRSIIGQHQINLQQTGANREGLNFEQLKNFNIPAPVSINDQNAIVEHLKIATAYIEQKKVRTEKLIDLLTEYRTALISEVVTGKIKVTE